MPAHSSLTGASLHEPKGVASATDGTVAQASSGAVSWTTLVNGSVPDGWPVQIVQGSTTTFTTLSTVIPYDNTIPQNTEGNEIMTVSITPKSATNKLLIRAVVNVGNENNSQTSIALFQDTTAAALAASAAAFDGVNDAHMTSLVLEYLMTAGTTSATTFKIRAGGSAGSTAYVNGGNGARKFGGVAVSTITVTEYKAS